MYKVGLVIYLVCTQHECRFFTCLPLQPVYKVFFVFRCNGLMVERQTDRQ